VRAIRIGWSRELGNDRANLVETAGRELSAAGEGGGTSVDLVELERPGEPQATVSIQYSLRALLVEHGTALSGWARRADACAKEALEADQQAMALAAGHDLPEVAVGALQQRDASCGRALA